MSRLLRVALVAVAAVVGVVGIGVLLFVLAYMFDDTRALPEVSAAQFATVDMGLTRDQLFDVLGPVTLAGEEEIAGRLEECWYYPVAGGPAGVANDAYRFCFFRDRLARKQHAPYPG